MISLAHCLLILFARCWISLVALELEIAIQSFPERSWLFTPPESWTLSWHTSSFYCAPLLHCSHLVILSYLVTIRSSGKLRKMPSQSRCFPWRTCLFYQCRSVKKKRCLKICLEYFFLVVNIQNALFIFFILFISSNPFQMELKLYFRNSILFHITHRMI